ncbi:MAG: hypothetical protein ACR2JY_05170 [Chloroflexota bacterium]
MATIVPTMPPSPAPTWPAPSTPTVAPVAMTSADVARAAARMHVTVAASLLGDHYFQNLARVAAALQAATRSYLKGVAGIATLQTESSARDDLTRLLTLPGRWGPGPTVEVPSLDGTFAVLLVSYPLTGLPVQAFYQLDGRLHALTLTPGLSSDRALGNFHMRFDRAVDVTGDGRKELIVRTDWLSGDSSPYTIGILGWDGRRLAPLFIGDVSNWSVGQADWQLVPHGGSQDVVMRCLAWGPFDHHLLQHPTLTRAYRWNGNAFTLANVALAPAIDLRDAFNRAEVAFRQGAYATAISRYRVVTSDHTLQPEKDDRTNWVALAWLRIGQSPALLGDARPAPTSLARAVAAGGTIDSLARAFGDALGPTDKVAQAFAALQASDGRDNCRTGRLPIWAT